VRWCQCRLVLSSVCHNPSIIPMVQPLPWHCLASTCFQLHPIPRSTRPPNPRSAYPGKAPHPQVAPHAHMLGAHPCTTTPPQARQSPDSTTHARTPPPPTPATAPPSRRARRSRCRPRASLRAPTSRPLRPARRPRSWARAG